MAKPKPQSHYLQTPPHPFPALTTEVRIEPELEGTETILVVDDNPSFRELLALALGAYGYDVIAAANGDDALDQIGRRAAPVHAVITDIVMPVLDGPELAAKLREWYPRLRVIFMSGHPDDPRAKYIGNDIMTRYLAKPVPISRLVRTLRELLDHLVHAATSDAR